MVASFKETVFGMVQRREITAAQATSLIQTMRQTSPRPAELSDRWVPIAVIGMSGRFPGAQDVNAFWDNLRSGQCTVSEVPADRWDVNAIYDPDPRAANKSYCKWAGMIGNAFQFDGDFFNISPKEASLMDPQQRLFLEEAWHALEDAGYSSQGLRGEACGVFVGVGSGDYVHKMADHGISSDGYAFSGNANSILAARIAYLMDLKGPCIAVDTACSSSLVAIHLACESIAHGNCRTALAGGVCVLNTPNFFVAGSKAGMLSPSGRCRTFDRSADGFVPGEAVGAILLKSLDDAIRDGDTIYGVIEASAMNQDGRTNGITAPSAPSQTALELATYARLGASPETITYIEAHGTGTRLGDPIEVEALTNAFRRHTERRGFCALASVKTNIGHAMSAAGISSVIKVLLAHRHRQLPPSLHFAEENESLELNETPFYVPTSLQSWESQGPRRAAISSFGFSGTNVHMVIGEPPRSEPRSASSRPNELIVVSAKSPIAMNARLADLESHLQNNPNAYDLADVAFTLATGRCDFEHRTALLCTSIPELVEKLQRLREDGQAADCQTSATIASRVVSESTQTSAFSDVSRSTLDALATRYVSGDPVDWSQLYSSGTYRRVSLPGYPFQRRDYQLPESTSPARLSGLHPLVDRVLEGEEGRLFETRLLPSLPFLRDHVVGDQKMLPGVCYLEMALAGLAELGGSDGGQSTSLNAVTFQHPLIVADQARMVNLRLRSEEEAYLFDVHDAEDSSRVFCRGVVEARKLNDSAPESEWLNIAEICQNAEHEVARETLYKLFDEAGVHCGPYCRGVSGLWLSSTEAFAELSLTPGETDSLHYYTLHPTLMDGAFQTAMAWLAHYEQTAAEGVLVPYAIERIEIRKRLGSSCFARVRRRAGERIVFDVAITDEDGNLQVQLHGFEARRIASKPERPICPSHETKIDAAPPAADLLNAASDLTKHESLVQQAPSEISFYRPVWIQRIDNKSVTTVDRPVAEYPIADQKSVDQEPNVTLVFRHERDNGFADWLGDQLPGRTVLQVHLGETYRSREPGTFEINHRKPHDYERLLCCLKRVDSIYFLGGITAEGEDAWDAQTLSWYEEHGVLSLLRLSRALGPSSHGSSENPLVLRIVTRLLQSVQPQDHVYPLAAALPGFAHVLSRESNDLRVSVMDLDDGEPTSKVLEDLGISPNKGSIGNEQPVFESVAYRNETRYLRVLERFNPSEESAASLRIREHGVYVVVGGAGGLGMTLARHLASTYQARVLLIGRRKLTDSLRQKLEDSGLGGGEVCYAQADVTDRNSLEKALADIQSRWGAIHGVVHAGMVLNDRLIDRMDDDAFQSVLAPKTRGTIELACALREQPLDFLVFFSSANSFFGNVGQSNYAAASTFQDGMARHLTNTAPWPVRIVNWGFWGEVGAVASPYFRRQASEHGMGAIGCTEGIAAFESCLKMGEPQVMPVKIAAKTLAAMGLAVEEATVTDKQLSSVGHAFQEVEQYACNGLVRCFRKAGLMRNSKQTYRHADFKASLRLAPQHERQLNALIAMLEEAGLLTRAGEVWRCTAKLASVDSAEPLAKTRERLTALWPWTTPFLGVLDACFSRYLDVLRGSLPATDVLFSPPTAEFVQQLYGSNPIVEQYNRQVADVVESEGRRRLDSSRSRNLRILEVGAGTGGTTGGVLESLVTLGDRIEFHFTDLSSGLVTQAKRRLSGTYRFAKFKRLDLEQSPAEQGFSAGGFDIVFASNVLHATRNVSQTLKHVRELLADDGVLVVNEAIRRHDFSTVTFGLTEGWWRFEDAADRLPHSPLLADATWRRQLSTCGFSSVASVSDDDADQSQRVFVAFAGRQHASEAAPVRKIAVNQSSLGFDENESPVKTRASSITGDGGPNLQEGNERIERTIVRQIAESLQRPSRDIDRTRPFADYGIDSVIGVELVQRLNHALTLDLPTTVLFQYRSVTQLASYIASKTKPCTSENAECEKTGGDEVGTEFRSPDDIFRFINESQTTDQPAASPPHSPHPVAEASVLQPSNLEGDNAPVAVVGIAGRFPGANNVEEFWELLAQGRCAISEVPRDRWDVHEYYDPNPQQPGKSPCKWGGFLSDVGHFDPLFFQMSGVEAEYTDPQQRLFLEQAWTALEDAGYSDKWLDGRRCGVFVGASAGDYTHQMIASGADPQPYAFMGNGSAILPSRISYLLNLKGPAVSIDTACSSSLVALHQAIQSLRCGECELAIAGGVFVSTAPSFHQMTGSLGMLSSSGQCRAFDDGADGFVPGEAVAAVVLRPLDEALRDGDHIYAVIRGSGINQDGRSNGLAAPNSLSQAELLQQVHREAGIDPRSISYVECHGTGTRLGDPIEMEALTKALGSVPPTSRCAVGSSKTNIGHAGPAAGLVGFLKVVLAMSHGQIPASLCFDVPNRHINFDQTPCYVNTKLVRWDVPDSGKRIAGVSSFGLSGTNAHVLLEQPPSDSSPESYCGKTHLLTVSAHCKASFEMRLRELADYFAAADSTTRLADVAYTLNFGRSHFSAYRAAVVVSDIDQAISKLRSLANGQKDDESYLGAGTSQEAGSSQCETIRNAINKLNAINDDETARVTILHDLGHRYVEGQDIDWGLFYSKADCRRISLPTYPFNRRRYWLPEKEESQSTESNHFDHNVHLYLPDWAPAPIIDPKPEADVSSVLVIDSTDYLCGILQKRLSQGVRSGSIIWCEPASGFTRCDQGHFQFDPEDPDQFDRLLDELERNDSFPSHIVVASFDQQQQSDRHGVLHATNTSNADQMLFGLRAMFYLAAALERNGRGTRVIHLQAEDLDLRTKVTASASAFSRSLQLLRGNLHWSSLILDGDIELSDACALLITEMSQPPTANRCEVRYQKGQRQVRHFESISLEAGTASKLRPGAVIWITGGAGSLGQIVARHLVNRHDAKVVLSGRTSPPLKDLNGMGSDISFVPCDVADLEQLRRAHDQILQRFGRLDGVIHAAGTIRPSLVHEKGLAEFEQVVRAKVLGAVNLDNVTRDDALTCFVCFSSIAAMVGDFGQCDYAAANRFLNCFAEWRTALSEIGERAGKTISINWPLWSDGGMNFSGEQHHAYLASAGIDELSTESGLELLDRSLNSNLSQLLVVAAESREDAALLLNGARISDDSSFRDHECQKNNSETFDGTKSVCSQHTVQSQVRRTLAELLKLDEEQLDDDAPFSAFGLDSLNMKALASRLSTFFGVTILPTALFEYNSISALAGHLVQSHSDQIRQTTPANGKGPTKFASDQESPASEASSGRNSSAVDQAVESLKTDGLTDNEPIAIIGMTGRFPQSADLRELADHLEQERDLVTEVPSDRWNWQGYQLREEDASRSVARWGGFMSDVDKFDAAFFEISPREAAFMDPQHRLFLEAVWSVIEDAGYCASSLAGKSVGVFVGCQFDEYAKLIGDAGEARPQAVLGNTRTMLANRVSYLFDFRGPSEVIDTACSSSLVAVHRAVRAIQTGECETAITGGVSLMLSPETLVLGDQMGMLSPDGRCKTFDESANGYVKGEGVGVVMLKRLSHALRDGDSIHAVIRGSMENHGGKANFLTAPNPEAQRRLLVDAYERAGVDPARVSYIETHGTGTELGDPIEVEALRAAFAELAKRRGQELSGEPHCGLGTVKSNIGHLEPAAGIAGLLKVVLAMQRRRLPATLHVKQVNPYLALEGSPFFLVTQTQQWLSNVDHAGCRLPLVAGVSSFGFGGVNAHVVLEEYVASPNQTWEAIQPTEPSNALTFSAKNLEALRELARRVSDFVKQRISRVSGKSTVQESHEDQRFWRSLVYTFQCGREMFTERLGVLAHDPNELCDKLDRWLEQPSGVDGVWSGSGGQISRVMELFDTSDELHQHLRREWDRGKTSKLIQLWVDGIDVPWSTFWELPVPCRISLPTYPFTRARHWCDVVPPGGMQAETRDLATPTANVQPLRIKSGRITLSPIPKSSAPVEPLALAPREEITAYKKETRVEPVIEEVSLRSESVVSESEIVAKLKTLVSEVLYLPVSQIDEDTGFTELGLDSILAVELAKRIANAFGADLRATRLYDHENIIELAKFLALQPSLNPSTASPSDVLPSGSPPSPDTRIPNATSTSTTSPVSASLNRSVSSRSVSGATVSATPPIEVDAGDEPVVSATNSAKAEHSCQTEVLQEKIQRRVRSLVGEVLYLDASKLEDELELLELGLDPITAGQLAKRIAAEFGHTISPSRLLGFESLTQLANHICAHAEEVDTSASLKTSPPKTFTPRIASASDSIAEKVAEERTLDGIAIVGLSGRFPGANDAEQFWQNLAAGVDSVIDIPSDRWEIEAVFDRRPGVAGKTYCRRGGLLRDVDRFDPLFFKISPQEAEVMDPQQRLFLQEAWKAFEDAGYADTALSGRQCAIFVGAGQGDYFRHIDPVASPGAQFGVGNVVSILAARLAYFLNLKGPAVAVETACSSSLVAVHLACQSLWSGECELALAGGVSLMTTPQMHIVTSQTRMLSPDGRCKTFDDGADGFVPGEGVGAIVLKRLADAVRDGDRIHAVIRGSGINQDGRTTGITSPSVMAQAALQQEVYRRFDIDPATITYVEAHGTGTKLGDPIELEALTESFEKYTERRQFCAIGSVKTNIGHTLPAAGIAGLIKVVLSLKHQSLPPSLHCDRENEHIGFTSTPFFVNRTLRPWESNGELRRAAINSFGFSGTNAHVVLEESPAPKPKAETNWPFYLLTVSAKTHSALRQRLTELAACLSHGRDFLSLADVSYTLNVGRSHFRHRLSVIARTNTEAVEKLQAILVQNPSGEIRDDSISDFGHTPSGEVVKEIRRRLQGGLIDADTYHPLLRQLSACYGRGETIDFESFHQMVPGHLVTLPTYPFANDRFWAATRTVAADDAGCRDDHPTSLIDEIHFGIRSSVARKHFKANDPLLYDHRVAGRLILPVAALLTMVRQVASLDGTAEPLNGLRGVDLPSSFEASADGRELMLRLHPDGELIKFEFSSGDEQVHARGHLLSSNIGHEVVDDLDINALKSRCLLETTADDIYERFKSLGIEYGSSYRQLQWIRAGDGEVLGRIIDSSDAALPGCEQNQRAEILDAAFQALLGFVPEDQVSVENMMLPHSIDWIWLHDGSEPVRYVHAELKESSEDGLCFDMSLTNDQGRVLLRFVGFRVRSIVAKQQSRQDEMVMLRRSWRRLGRIDELMNYPREDGKVLLVRPPSDFGLTSILKGELGEDSVMEIELGSYLQRLDECRWSVDVDSSTDLDDLLNDGPDFDHVLFLGALQTDDSVLPDVIEKSQKLGVWSLLRVVQALANRDKPMPSALSVITNNVHGVRGNDPVLPHGASTIGLARVIDREFGDLEVRCVDLLAEDLLGVNQSKQHMIRLLAGDEDGWLSAENLASVRREGIYISDVERMEWPVGDSAELALRENGVVLIIGGAGGLGMEFAKRFAQQSRARVALVGRSPLTPEMKERLRSIEQAGGQAIYCQADVTNLDAMLAVKQTVMNRWGAINAVIHAAMVLGDRTLLRMDEETFQASLAPKVQGTAVLNEILTLDSLDWIVFFSSSISFTANAGQGNYMAGSAFQDAFGQHLQQFNETKILVINWGLWGSIGAVADDFHRQRAAALGVGSIEPEEGFEILQRALGANLRQIAPIRYLPETWRQRDMLERNPAGTLTNTKTAGLRSTERELRNCVRTVLCHVLKLESADLEDTVPLEDYGVDSLVAIEILQRLENQVGALPKTLLFEHKTVDALVSRIYEERVDDSRAGWISAEPTSLSAKSSAALPVAAKPIEPAPSESLSPTSNLLTPIRETGSEPSSFWVHSVMGEISWAIRLAEQMGPDWPVYAFQAIRPGGTPIQFPDLSAMASSYVSEVRQVQPRGPYILGGYSMGGVVAFEMARQLHELGEPVSRLVLLDSYAPGGAAMASLSDTNDSFMVQAAANVLALQWKSKTLLSVDALAGLDRAECIETAAAHLLASCDMPYSGTDLRMLLDSFLRVMRYHADLLENYQPRRLDIALPTTLFRNTGGFVAEDNELSLRPIVVDQTQRDHGWNRWLRAEPEIIEIPADHFSMGLNESMSLVANTLTATLGRNDANRQDVFEVVRQQVLAVLSGVEERNVTLDIRLSDLGANSIDRVEIATLAMESLNVELPRNTLARVKDLRSLVDALEHAQTQRSTLDQPNGNDRVAAVHSTIEVTGDPPLES